MCLCVCVCVLKGLGIYRECGPLDDVEGILQVRTSKWVLEFCN